MGNLEGKTWGSLTPEQKENLLNRAFPISGIDMTKVDEGECIVDFDGFDVSIPGLVRNDEIIIQDNAVFYNPFV